jgi:hypothetical protein
LARDLNASQNLARTAIRFRGDQSGDTATPTEIVQRTK